MMTKRVTILILCFLALSTIGFLPHVSALSCAPLDIERLMENEKVYDGVIVATITDYNDTGVGLMRHLEVDVLESYKGVSTTPLIIIEENGWGPPLSNIEDTYIYGLTKKGDEWIIGICGEMKSTDGYYAALYTDLAKYNKVTLNDDMEAAFTPTEVEEQTSSHLFLYAIACVVLLLIVSLFTIKKRDKLKR